MGRTRRAGGDGVADIGMKGRRHRGVGDVLVDHDAHAVLDLPDVLQHGGGAEADCQHHDGDVAGHVTDWRAGQHDVAGVEMKAPAERIGAGDQAVRGVHHPLRRTRRSGGEHHHREIVGMKRRCGGAGGSLDSRAALEQQLVEAVLALAVDDDHVLELGQLGAHARRHRFVVEATEQLGHDQHLGLGEGQHVTELALAEDRHERVDDRPEPAAGQRDDNELPPVRQLDGDDVAPADAEAEQRAGSARDLVAELGIAETRGLGSIDPVADHRRLVRRSGDRGDQVVVDGAVQPEPARAHRAAVGSEVEGRNRHAVSPAVAAAAKSAVRLFSSLLYGTDYEDEDEGKSTEKP